MNFDDAFISLIGREGGYVNNHADPGGETKFGICKRDYPAEDIANMTIDRAKEIYARDYWARAGCDVLPDDAKLQVFDAAVNMGVTAAIRMIQRTVSVAADGVLGPTTLKAVQSMPAERFIARFNGSRLSVYTDLPTWPSFGRGWARRVAANLLEA